MTDLYGFRAVPYPSLWAVVHEDGILCWNYCDPTPDRTAAEANVARNNDKEAPYRCMQSPTHRVVEYQISPDHRSLDK